MNYITTFYSHFGAIHYKRMCEKNNIQVILKPVPRTLSSSCGTCAFCTGNLLIPDDESINEIEQIVENTVTGYKLLFSNM